MSGSDDTVDRDRLEGGSGSNSEGTTDPSETRRASVTFRLIEWTSDRPGRAFVAVVIVGGFVVFVLTTGNPVAVFGDFLGRMRRAIETATGPVGVLIALVYSFLIAFVLPLPSELVLVASMGLGLSEGARLAVIMLVSGLGKAPGSVVALRAGTRAQESGPVTRALRRSRFDIVEWSERRSVDLAQRYGYLGMAMALSMPFFPDTASIHSAAIRSTSGRRRQTQHTFKGPFSPYGR